MIAIDHVGIMARDPAASARFLGEVLGIATSATGPDGDIFRLDIGESGILLYFPAASGLGQHVAFESIKRLLTPSWVACAPKA
jgi:catechol 2,3-dioxygenase-like lactoylglutathione lyase family enzyme